MTRIYQHTTTGDVWAVRLSANETIVEAQGPLYVGNVSAYLADNWDGDPETAEWMRELDTSDAGYWRDVTARFTHPAE